MISADSKKLSRVFVAFPMQASEAEKLKLIQQQNSSLSNIRWTPGANLHLTVFFIGEILNEHIDPAIKSISEVARGNSPFEIGFEKITWAGKKMPHGMIWAQFFKNDFYSRLSSDLHQALKEFLTVHPVFKDPIPHVTLARMNKAADINKINLHFEENFSIPQISYCELWKTMHTPEGVRYDSLKRFDFQN
jgi:2'-5' RNA ligase